MIKVTKRNGESAEKLLKRFSGHVKSRRLIQKFRSLRYCSQKPRKINVRETAVIREGHREENKKKQFMN